MLNGHVADRAERVGVDGVEADMEVSGGKVGGDGEERWRVS